MIFITDENNFVVWRIKKFHHLPILCI